MKAFHFIPFAIVLAYGCSKSANHSTIGALTNYEIHDSTTFNYSGFVDSTGHYIDTTITMHYPQSYQLSVTQFASDTSFVIMRGDTFYWRADYNVYEKVAPAHSVGDYDQIAFDGDSLTIKYFVSLGQNKQNTFTVTGTK